MADETNDPWKNFLDSVRRTTNEMFDVRNYTGRGFGIFNRRQYNRLNPSRYQPTPGYGLGSAYQPPAQQPGFHAYRPELPDMYTPGFGLGQPLDIGQPGRAPVVYGPTSGSLSGDPYEYDAARSYPGNIPNVSAPVAGGTEPGDQSGTGGDVDGATITPNDPADALSQAPPPGYTGVWGGQMFYDGQPGYAGEDSPLYQPYYYNLSRDWADGAGGRWAIDPRTQEYMPGRYRTPGVQQTGDEYIDPNWTSSYSRAYYAQQYAPTEWTPQGRMARFDRSDYRRGSLYRQMMNRIRRGEAQPLGGPGIGPPPGSPASRGPRPEPEEIPEEQKPEAGLASGLSTWRP
jgi:hypothetical protein